SMDRQGSTRRLLARCSRHWKRIRVCTSSKSSTRWLGQPTMRRKSSGGFLQIPGKVVGGEAPADCLAGKGCIGDARMAALAVENERLAADAAGVRNLLAAEEQARGKPNTIEERQKRVAELEQTLAGIGSSTDPLRREARPLIGQGNVSGGQAKLDEAL